MTKPVTTTSGVIAFVPVLAAVIAPRIVPWLSPPPPSGLLFASGRIEGRITTARRAVAAKLLPIVTLVPLAAVATVSAS